MGGLGLFILCSVEETGGRRAEVVTGPAGGYGYSSQTRRYTLLMLVTSGVCLSVAEEHTHGSVNVCFSAIILYKYYMDQ